MATAHKYKAATTYARKWRHPATYVALKHGPIVEEQLHVAGVALDKVAQESTEFGGTGKPR